MSKIGTSEVERLARLARIGLTADEVTRFAVELDGIVEFVEKLRTVDVKDVEPTDQVTGLMNVLRPDEVHPATQNREQLLAGAPETEGGYIKVRRILG